MHSTSHEDWLDVHIKRGGRTDGKLTIFYESEKRSFSDGPSEEEDGSRRIVERDGEHPPLVGSEVPCYHARAYTLANERDNSLKAISHCVE